MLLYDQISLHVCLSHPTVEVNASLKASRSKSQPGRWATNQKRRRVSGHPDHPLSLSLGVWVGTQTTLSLSLTGCVGGHPDHPLSLSHWVCGWPPRPPSLSHSLGVWVATQTTLSLSLTGCVGGHPDHPLSLSHWVCGWPPRPPSLSHWVCWVTVSVSCVCR